MLKRMASNDFLLLRRWVLLHPALVIVCCLALVFMCATGLRNSQQTSDYRVYFGDNNPDLAAFLQFEDDFEQYEVTILAVKAQQGHLFTPRRLKALRELTESGWYLPYSLRSASITNFQHSYAKNDDIVVEPLVPEIGELTKLDALNVKRLALATEDLVGRLLSPAGDVAGIAIVTPLPHENLEKEVPLVANAIEAMIIEFERSYPDLRVYKSGVIPMNQAMKQTMDWDAKHLHPIVVVGIFLGLLLFFRSFVPALLTWLVIVLASVAAYGAAGYLGFVINAASFAGVLIILTLGVADCIHLCVSYYQELAARHQKYDALLESMRMNWQPVFLTSLTTAIGFLCLNFSESPPFRDLGNIVAIGVVFAWLLSTLLLPAALILFPVAERAKQHWGSGGSKALGDFVVRQRRPLFWLGIVAIVAICGGVNSNRFGDNYAEYFSEDIDFRVDTDFINSHLTGMQAISYAVDSGEPGAVNEPEYLRQLERFSKWWESQPEFRKAVNIVGLHKRLNRTLNEDDEEFYRLPETREIAAQNLLFYSFSLPAGLSLNNMVDADQQRSRFSVLLETIPAYQLEGVIRRAEAWMLENWPPAMRSEAAGTGVMFAKIARRNFASMIQGTGLAIGLIAILLAITFRSIGLGLISIVPNLVPTLLAFGVWGYSVQILGISLAVVTSITLGIVVDDTIHFMSKYRRARLENDFSAAESVKYAFNKVAVALILTSVVLCVGFLALSQSSYQLVSHMAAMTGMTIVFALLADFFFLPPLLMMYEDWRDRRLAAKRH